MDHSSRILIADDQPGITRMLSLLLEKAGYEVLTAESGKEALDIVTTEAVDLVILDVMMPDLSGIDVCRQLRMQPETARIPVMMLSAKGQVTDKVAGFEAGADDYIAKPVAREELIARVNALLTRSRYAQKPSQQARVIAFVGAKGGVGTTTLATNVGTFLAKQGARVVLAEMHAAPGTAVYHLKVEAGNDLGLLLEKEPQELRWAQIQKALSQHSQSGLLLLPAPQQPDFGQIPAQHASVILSELALQYDYVILDLADVAGEANQEMLNEANDIILVSEPELLSMSAARAILRHFHTWALADRVQVAVMARSPAANLMTRSGVTQQLYDDGNGKGVACFVPPAPEMFQTTSRLGVPIVLSRPDTVPARAIREFVETLAPQPKLAVPT